MTAWPLWLDITVFGAAVALIGVGGVRLAAFADRLADRTGWGEAVTGALFLGVSTSIPGISASVTAAIDGFPSLAVSNAMGGIAVQTAFLAVADVFHRRANLEHAAASVVNLVQSTLLILLLTLVLLSMTSPGWTVAHVHPGTPVLVGAYLFGMRLAFRSSSDPMWMPKRTGVTVEDHPDPEHARESLGALWAGFAIAAILVAVGGFAVARTAGAIVTHTGISESLMGGVFTAVSTSLPELVTTVAAVRRGALTLAVSDIVGGNAFDVLFVCAADAVYLDGSIFHAAGPQGAYLAALTLLLNVILLLGLIQREKRGLGNIGFESVLILLVYTAGMVLLSVMS